MPSPFFYNDPPTTEIYTLSLHDALPIPALFARARTASGNERRSWRMTKPKASPPTPQPRSEEHTSELQSPYDLVCRLLLEKKKNNTCMTDSAENINDENGMHSQVHTRCW